MIFKLKQALPQGLDILPPFPGKRFQETQKEWHNLALISMMENLMMWLFYKGTIQYQGNQMKEMRTLTSAYSKEYFYMNPMPWSHSLEAAHLKIPLK